MHRQTINRVSAATGPPRQSILGFTLIELLVVIAVISILASLLMPAVIQAMSASQATRCQSNLHQIGGAFITYVHNFKGMMPSHDDEPGLTYDVFGQKMYWQFAHGQLVPLMKDYRVFWCPSDVTVMGKELGANRWWSYAWNTRVGAFNHSTKVFRHRNIAECKFPTKSITFLDGAEGDGGMDGNDDRPYQPGGAGAYFQFTRHNLGFNALFVDGHVTHYRLGETEAENYDW